MLREADIRGAMILHAPSGVLARIHSDMLSGLTEGSLKPVLRAVFPLEQAGQAAYEVHCNAHQGKVGVLALAPSEGLGVTDPELRAKHLTSINRFRVDSSPISAKQSPVPADPNE